jgi:glutathione S-transferase
MMELHQFRHSAFCEKVRLILAFKGLDATVVEVTPGLGQLELFRLSGQRQVPVLVEGGEVIADSTSIALHLENRHPLPALLPPDPVVRARILLLEDWADTALASGARLALLQAAVSDPALRAALLPDATPSPLRNLVGAFPGGVMAPLADAVRETLTPCQARQMRRNLETLTEVVSRQRYLEGTHLSLADLAVAAQLSLLKFPAIYGAPLAGRGVDGIADNPVLEPLFEWRDRIAEEAGRG